MELQLTDDQKLLRETTERFIVDTCPLEQVRRVAEGESELDPDYQATAAELGWFAMLVPEERGGGNVSGEGLRDLAIVAEERGRRLQPGPFVGTNVLAATLADSGSFEGVLDDLLTGKVGGTWAMGAGAWSPGPGVEVTAEGAGYRLAGEAHMVHDGPAADWVLISARDGAGASQFLVRADHDGIVIDPVRSLDISQTFATVRLDNVALDPEALVGARGDAAVQLARQLDTAVVLVVADIVGAADALFSLTLEYAKERTAFGRPIGSFQALKHQLADLSLSLEAAKAIAVEATRSVQARDGDAGILASIAKAWTGDVAVDIAQGCLQVFGGIGYTWEHDLHLYLRRLTINSQLYGQPRWHRRRIWAAQPMAAQPPTLEDVS
jgi:alkylation response protein AidB-like acyl-CoA dehydrogenase